ncbi:methyl-accepting chemotaxis protein [uncultured Devosia sp.]|uniref:methyl-accepting chemotaxis protein n=1 Tax=uncultured Devosia sp. TaxID=211434 RepID=UPI0035C99B4D
MFANILSGGAARRIAAAQAVSIIDAISRSQASIEFSLDGTILDANENFLAVFGYERADIIGQHHRLFVDPDTAASPHYAQFWQSLARGEFQAAEYKRIGKGGKQVWIQASYNPVLGRDGKPAKVIKFATDVTASKLAAADWAGQLAAISKSQAVIAFNLAGEVLTANANFCTALGYRLDEIVGRHHRMFVLPEQIESPQYKAFWAALGRGEYQSAEYLRVGKGGRHVWIQASYNPIFDLDGKAFKIVKYATDITARKASVDALSQGLSRLATGDLTTTIDTPFLPDMEDVRATFNRTTTTFSDIIGQIRQTSGALKSATGEILLGSNNLSERTTRQAASIEETSAAMEQLAATVLDNTRRAESASAVAQSVSGTTEQTGTVMARATDAMERIMQSSAKISNIIGMIDDIAFQTNLLALNASVEAARAGDAGKGFAVVAVEVRRLAQSAASASSDVKALIEQSATEVLGGSKLVSEASQKLELMLDGVRQNRTLIEAIAKASQDQSAALVEVSNAISEMDELTQHNAALVEQTNAAIGQTESQASKLDQIVEVFTVGSGVVSAPIQNGAAPGPASAKPVARSYRNAGNAALKTDWEAF